MKVFLVRHTQLAIKPGICYGQSNVAVAETFLQELSEIETKLAGQTFDACLSSPLKRCIKLAQQLYTKEIHKDARLLELDFGEWEMKPWDEVDRKTLDMWSADFVMTGPDGGESLQELSDRVTDFWRELQTTYSNHESVLVVTHAGVIRCILSHIQKTALKDTFMYLVNPGEVIEINGTNATYH